MAVALDAAGPGAASPGTGGATSLNWSHTIGGSNRLLVVFLAYKVGLSTATSVTCGASSMTKVNSWSSVTGSNDRIIEMWKLIAPPTGAQTITASFPSTECAGGSISFTGVDQTTPVGTPVSSVGSSASLSVVVGSASDGMVASGLSAFITSAPTATGTSQVADFAQLAHSDFYGTGSHQPGGTSVTASWTLSGAAPFALVGVPVWAVGSVPGGSTTRPRPAVIRSTAVTRASVI